MSTKQIIGIVSVLAIIGIAVGLSKDINTVAPSVPPVPISNNSSANLCYYTKHTTTSGLTDQSWIRLRLEGGAASGEFNTYPAEKDSKVGTFTGTISAPDPTNQSRIASVIWDSHAEGMESKEELVIKYDATSSQAGFGEMIQGANGVYVYKDRANVVYQDALPSVDCATLDEIRAVQTYIRSADLKTLIKDQPAVGGTFFLTAVVVDPVTHTALITYEDGHISGKETLSYSFDPSTDKVTIGSATKSTQ